MRIESDPDFDHFAGVGKMVDLGCGSQREVACVRRQDGAERIGRTGQFYENNGAKFAYVNSPKIIINTAPNKRFSTYSIGLSSILFVLIPANR